MRRPTRAEIDKLLRMALDKALDVQRPAVVAHLDRAMARNPAPSPAQMVERIEKQYLVGVIAMGAAAGASAAAPGVGTAVALPINLLEIGTFLEASTLFVLALAELHDIDTADLAQRRTLVVAILLGEQGAGVVQKLAGRTGPHWARAGISSVPAQSLKSINNALGKNFVTKYGTKQGILVLGRELPLGIGAAIGASGNLGLGYLTIRAARHAFGPPPTGQGMSVATSPPPPQPSDQSTQVAQSGHAQAT